MLKSKKEILEIIRYYRKKRHIDQATIAKQLKVARSTYQAIETGRHRLTVEDFVIITRFLKIPTFAFDEKAAYIINLTEDEIRYWNQINEKISLSVQTEEEGKSIELFIKNKNKV